MIITLSEERSEKLLIEWSDEMTDEHAQDFCDVCNAVFAAHFDLDYMHRKYGGKIYGSSFINVVYRDGSPKAAIGAWRADLDGRPAFHLVDFASLKEERNRGYALDMLYGIFDAVRTIPGAVTYAVVPGSMSYPLYEALGFAVKGTYMRPYSGLTRDFLDNMPMIDDCFAEEYLTRKNNIYVRKIRGKYYLFLRRDVKGIIPGGIFLGEVKAELAGKFRKGGAFMFMRYYSPNMGKFIKYLRKSRNVLYDPSADEQVMTTIPPMYKLDGFALDFNGENTH